MPAPAALGPDLQPFLRDFRDAGRYVRVLLIEALVIWLLWLVSRHFSY